MITVVGLGREKGDLTANGKKAIKKAQKVFCRTLLTQPFKFLKGKAESFDRLFESSRDFSELNNKIVEALIESPLDNIVYCVDGDGFSDEAVKLLCQKTDVNIVAGVSNNGARTPGNAIVSLSAYELTETAPLIDTNFPLCVKDIDSQILAGEVKLSLLEFYPPEAAVRFSKGRDVTIINLEDLDRLKKYDSTCSAFIEGDKGFEKGRYCFADLLKIMNRLTEPQGCEWDKAQTHSSIRINMIEEAYEAVDAIDSGDIGLMIEETGDVLLQTVFHSDIAKRSGEYNIFDVVDSLCKKLVSRHTHIFGENKAENAAAALNFWEKAKQKEKKHKSLSDELSSIPAVFPASLKAEKMIKKAIKAGYVADEDKIREELLAAIRKCEYEKALFLTVLCLTLGKKDAETELNALCKRFFEAAVQNKEKEIHRLI